ncbi:hypothetical protein [Embleya sp. MST-111070]|uniref:hypothetical protein n=1 Tax=Embleya sp. MST-111070 TaxID=3398231 RepID=UPI003F73BB4E
MTRARLNWTGAAALAGTREGAARGLRVAAEHVLGESRKLVPLDEGTLERSGAAVVDDAELTAAVSYDTPYAVRVHEDMTARHAPGRQAKYLEQPLAEQAPVVAALIAAEVRRSLR